MRWTLTSVYVVLFLVWMLMIFVVLGIYRILLNPSLDRVYELSANAFFAFWLAIISIAVPIHFAAAERRKEESARFAKEEESRKLNTIVAANYLHSELTQNLSMLEFVDGEFKKDYSKQDPPSENLTSRNKQDIEMGKIRRAANEVLLTITDDFYKSMTSSQVLIQIKDGNLAATIQAAYQGIKYAKDSLRRQSDLFAVIQDKPPSTAYAERIHEYSRQHKVPKAIEVVNDDVEYAIARTKVALEALEDALKPYGKTVKIIYRDDAIAEMKRGKRHNS